LRNICISGDLRSWILKIRKRFKESSQICLGQALGCLKERLSAAAKKLFIRNGCCAAGIQFGKSLKCITVFLEIIEGAGLDLPNTSLPRLSDTSYSASGNANAIFQNFSWIPIDINE